MHRVREGVVMVRNPRNPNQVQRVSLRPEDVVAVVFWSRDYGQLLPHLAELDDLGLRPCFQFTLTGYGPPLEPRSPAIETIVPQFEALAQRYGRDRVSWRYDPIVLGSLHDTRSHEVRFAQLARLLAPFTSRCVVSFLDPYPSTLRELSKLQGVSGETFPSPTLSERLGLAKALSDLGRSVGITVSACCEADLLPVVPRARCIDPELIRSFAIDPNVGLRDAPTRKGCGCVLARDIGVYDTCAHGCAYCYACESPAIALRNAQHANPKANALGPQDVSEHRVEKPSPQLSLLAPSPRR